MAKLPGRKINGIKPLPLKPESEEFLEWEEQVTRHIEEHGEVDRSDAQGIMMCRDRLLRRCHSEGKCPAETGDLLLEAPAEPL
ncbi:hypothetical protein AAW51_4048 [Caldimonas brevitalea]|uniref:Uncharacterized protein n=2 Tax=Caldimonas brevitalea TaxID=413882 RepID=A0A0G3BMP7_9BURK|nr:hypothetical protein AAW51_4048 [Caldimonas brevitalea]